MIREDEILKAGKFLRPHGLKGELNAYIDYDPGILDDDDVPVILCIDGIYVPFYTESVRVKGIHGVLVKFEGIDSEEEARAFVNREFYLRKKDLADYFDMDEDELLEEFDLEGYRVTDRHLGYLGRVEAIDDSTENVLLIVRPDDEDAPVIYIPFVDDFVKCIIRDEDSDAGCGVIEMELPEGLVDLNV